MLSEYFYGKGYTYSQDVSLTSKGFYSKVER